MSVWAIVPVKPLNRAKSRLAAVLPPEVREKLAAAMLHRTLIILGSCPEVTGVLVISRDSRALVIARQFGAKTVQESGTPELNNALARASQVTISWGAKTTLIVPADLPLLLPPDIKEMIQLGRYHHSVVLAPDRRNEGTNGLLMCPPGVVTCTFGPGSLEKHAQAARASGATLHFFRSERMMLDLDTPEDLVLYLELCKKYGIEPLLDFELESLVTVTPLLEQEKMR